MAAAPRSRDLRNSLPPAAAGNGDRDAAARRHRSEPAAKDFRVQFDQDRGALLGGVVFGVGGCLLGASMPCQHSAGVAASTIWWGIYMGCFGLSIGALLGLWVGSILASRRGDVQERNHVGAETDIPPAAPGSTRCLILPPTKWPRYVPVPLQAQLLVNRKG